MQLQTVEIDGKTYALVSDGKPLYKGDDGKEIAFDAVATATNLTALRGEAMRHRQDKEDAQKALKPFEGLDADKARTALETVANLDQKKLIDAGEVERVKSEVAKGWQEKLTEAEGKLKTLEGALYAEKIGGSFARSALIVGDKAKLAIPADMVEARFGSHFKVEDGRAVAYRGPDGTGERIYSSANPSVLADFDEALDILVQAYPHKESILRSVNPNGAPPGGGPTGGAKTMKSSDFNALSAKDRAAKMADGYQITE